jgi:hypothetical protein
MTSSISNQLPSPVLRILVSGEKFPVAGEGFPFPFAQTMLRGDKRSVLGIPISLSNMRPWGAGTAFREANEKILGELPAIRKLSWTKLARRGFRKLS